MVELYWNLKDETKNADFQSLSKKIKRSPYNALLMRKFNLIMELNDRRFCQLTFVLKRTVGSLSTTYSGLTHIVCLSVSHFSAQPAAAQVNAVGDVAQLGTAHHAAVQQMPQRALCAGSAAQSAAATGAARSTGRGAVGGGGTQAEWQVQGGDARQCLQQHVSGTADVPQEHRLWLCAAGKLRVLFQFSTGLLENCFQYVAQTRMEQNALDLIFGLFNMGEQDAWREHQLHQQQHNAESTSSSLEILRTLNISFAAGDYHAAPAAALCDSAQDFNADATKDHQSLRLKHTESFLQKERIFIAQLIAKATEICPTIFGEQGTRYFIILPL